MLSVAPDEPPIPAALSRSSFGPDACPHERELLARKLNERAFFAGSRGRGDLDGHRQFRRLLCSDECGDGSIVTDARLVTTRIFLTPRRCPN